jgi:hypothetical protein
MDQSKKTMRHFYCRDVLWETFEQMANDFDCSIDYLINEAMRYYARSKNYQTAMAPAGPAPHNSPGPQPGMVPGPGMGGYPAPGPGYGAQPRTQPPMGPGRGPGPGPGPGPNHGHAPGHGPGPGGPRGAPPPPPMGAPGRRPGQPSQPPIPRGPTPAAGYGGAPTLYLIYNNQRYPITKDQFIIGRGSKTSDLPIKDGNISRKHAAVIRRNGTYYIKDLGSTNGIDYKGMRIDNKRIDEGDIFHLCDYELRFTYRPD